MKCPGCEATKLALLAMAPLGLMLVGIPKAWMPPHLPECPAATPTKVLGMDVWTYADEKEES